MNIPRVTHLIEVLKKVQEQELPFDMMSWFENRADPHNCGTAACMLGWAARDPEFKAQDLHISRLGSIYYAEQTNGRFSEDAGALFFDLPQYYFFATKNYSTLDEVISRLETDLTAELSSQT